MKKSFSRVVMSVLPFLLCFVLCFSCFAFAEDSGDYTIAVVSETDDSSASEARDSPVAELQDNEVPLASGEQLNTGNDSRFVLLVAGSAAALIVCFIVVKAVIDRRNDRKFAEKLGVKYPF